MDSRQETPLGSLNIYLIYLLYIIYLFIGSLNIEITFYQKCKYGFLTIFVPNSSRLNRREEGRAE